MPTCTAVILAAGRGRRMGGSGNKAFLELLGIPLVAHAVGAFQCHPRVERIVLVVGPGEEETARLVLRDARADATIVLGGERRRDSALAGIAHAKTEVVLIHDGARPFPSSSLIDRVLDGVSQSGACVPVLPAADTLRYVSPSGDLQTETIDRTRLVHIQTPQGFLRAQIEAALRSGSPDLPDDAAALLALGRRVHTVLGDRANLKITHSEDLDIARRIGSSLL